MKLLQVVLIAALWGLLCSTVVASEPSSRPNILFIFTDDQRADTIGAFNPSIITPNLDALAASGVVFDRAYVTTAICSPSRASTLTGRYGTRNGVTTLSGEINANEITFAEYLANVGYATAQFGKWHLENTPGGLGFQTYARINSNGSWFQRDIDTNIPDAPPKLNGEFYEKAMADLVIDYIEAEADSESPFVIWWCNQVPHLDNQLEYPDVDNTQSLYDAADMQIPLSWQDDPNSWTAPAGQRPPYLASSRFVTKPAFENYGGFGGYNNLSPGIRNPTRGEDNVQNHLREYYAAISALDVQIGRVIDRLSDPNGDGNDADSILDNTWIIFMGDNGWFTGHHRFTSKVLSYEEAARIPMIVKAPNVAARVESNLVLNIDLTRMILDIAGVNADTSHLQGMNLSSLIDNPETEWRDTVYLEGVISESSLGADPFDAVVHDRYKFIRTYSDSSGVDVVWEELYDLAVDPDEMINLSSNSLYAITKQSLTAKLNQIKAEIANSPNPEQVPDSEGLLNGDFEAVPYDYAWYRSGAIDVAAPVGMGQHTSMRFPYNVLSTAFQNVIPTDDFHFSTRFHISGAFNPSMHLYLGAAKLSGQGDAMLGVRIFESELQVSVGGTWLPVQDSSTETLIAIEPDTVYELHINGRDFGTRGAEYDLWWYSVSTPESVYSLQGSTAFSSLDNVINGEGIGQVFFHQPAVSGDANSFIIDDVQLANSSLIAPASNANLLGLSGSNVLFMAWAISQGESADVDLVAEQNLDDDHDGIERLVEYAFGGTFISSDRIADLMQVDTSGTDLVITMVVRDNDASLNIAVEKSSSLLPESWQLLGINDEILNVSQLNVPSGFRRRSYAISMLDGLQFIRLVADIE